MPTLSRLFLKDSQTGQRLLLALLLVMVLTQLPVKAQPAVLCAFVQQQVPIVATCSFAQQPRRQFEIILNRSMIELMERNNKSTEALTAIADLIASVHFNATRDNTEYETVIVRSTGDNCAELTRTSFNSCVVASNGDLRSTRFAGCIASNLRRAQCTFGGTQNYSARIETRPANESPAKQLCAIVKNGWSGVSECQVLPGSHSVFIELSDGVAQRMHASGRGVEYGREMVKAAATVLENIRSGAASISAKEVIMKRIDSKCISISMTNYLRCVGRPGGIDAADFGDCVARSMTIVSCPSIAR